MTTKSGWCLGYAPIHEDCPQNFTNQITPDCDCRCHTEEKPHDAR